MISSGNLRFMTDDGAAQVAPESAAEPPPVAPPPAAPDVFVRTISAPPGMPWDQQRVADLEARHGSPLPIAEVVYLLRRLEGWRPGAPGRFAAFYVLAQDVDGRLDATAEVDGRALSVTFVTGGARIAQAGQAALRTVAVAALAVLAAWSVAVAIGHRTETAAAIQLTEQRAQSKLKRVEVLRRGQDLDRALRLELAGGVPLKSVLADLAWVSNAKATDARIESLHWEPGLIAVTAKGEASPFQPVTDRQVRRAAKPVGRGVWLWGVTEPAASTGQPVAAQVRP